MNTGHWIRHFTRNTPLNDSLRLPPAPVTLPDEIRLPLAASLAVFQLGESGGGTRLRRYAREVAPLVNFRGYQRAVDLFIAEEQSHSRLLERVVLHLGGSLIEKQWTNSVFRRLRGLVNLEFAIQVLLTAELVAEIYYGALYLRVSDPVVRVMARKILQDETRHLEFQREFLSERLATFSPAGRWLWRLQFEAVHAVTAAVVAWDHRHCLKALGVGLPEFFERTRKAWAVFQRRLDSRIRVLRECGGVAQVLSPTNP
ncbi:MAG TPA: hypothetical protein DIT64_12395 [Verrucomicrobiales bacterium]|nr:hypothetical protein [Verrucomicrobiales bacterium]HCN76414.1 hypothetical protein [Verrucomicrobiales bacterium]HRJ08205.1 ferritin-like domain-containing protein [Prosthecobacter sp.]HRK16128.1 ferritin-like domain-containing protein [Prosthecobacter sp.]